MKVYRLALASLLVGGYALSVPALAHPPDRLVYAGARGSRVVQIQRVLAESGLSLQVDGRFGPETRAAVLTFQRAKNLKKIDGIVGPETRAALAAVIQPAVARAAPPVAVKLPAPVEPKRDTLRESWRGATRDFIYLAPDGESYLRQPQQHDGEDWRSVGEPEPYVYPWKK